MKRKAKSTAAKRGRGTWLIVAAAIILVLILLLRMLIFVAPHGTTSLLTHESLFQSARCFHLAPFLIRELDFDRGNVLLEVRDL